MYNIPTSFVKIPAKIRILKGWKQSNTIISRLRKTMKTSPRKKPPKNNNKYTQQ